MSVQGIVIIGIILLAALVLAAVIIVLLLYDVRLDMSLKGRKKPDSQDHNEKDDVPEQAMEALHSSKPVEEPDQGGVTSIESSLLARIPFGSSVLLMGVAPEKVHHFLKHNFDDKCHEIIFSRVNERILREKYEFKKNSTFFWITHKPEGDFQISVSDISKLFWNIKQVALNLKRTVIYVDCLEYLVFINSFSPVMRMMNEVIDLISNLQIILVVSIDARAFEEKELTLIERSVGIVCDERRHP